MNQIKTNQRKYQFSKKWYSTNLSPAWTKSKKYLFCNLHFKPPLSLKPTLHVPATLSNPVCPRSLFVFTTSSSLLRVSQLLILQRLSSDVFWFADTVVFMSVTDHGWFFYVGCLLSYHPCSCLCRNVSCVSGTFLLVALSFFLLTSSICLLGDCWSVTQFSVRELSNVLSVSYIW